MPSPFPGMNPYLEQEDSWHSFHGHLCLTCLELLVPATEPNYIVQSDVNVYIHELSAEERILHGRPDVTVARSSASAQPSRQSSAVAEAPVYAIVPPAVDIERHHFIEIRDTQNRELITAIEFLSPTNKKYGPDREQYLAKRRRYFASSVHFIEIDLLRGFDRMPLENLPDCDYCVAVSRMEERPRVGVWPLRLRDALPVIPIPLRAPDPDVTLDLQAALHRVYDAGGYKNYIYSGTPQPPLHPEDAVWARKILESASGPK